MGDSRGRIHRARVGFRTALLTASAVVMALASYPIRAQLGTAEPITCDQSEESCAGTISSLFAIAHGYPQDETETTVLYRVTVSDSSNTDGPQPGSWSPDVKWGDGTNGFFYQAIVNGDTDNRLIYVPFNGIGVDTDGHPAMPPFSFIVPVNITASSPTVAISACASNFGGSGVTPTCTKTFWTDSYESLPRPDAAQAPVSINFSTFSFAECLGQSCSIPNNGVYPFMLKLTIDPSISGTDLDWVKDHLVFFDKDGNAYLNDIRGQQLGVLMIDEAAYQSPVDNEYHTKYGDGFGITPPGTNEVNLFFYTTVDASADSFFVGAAVIHDRPDNCTGFIEPSFTTNQQCSDNSAPPPNISPQAELAPVDWTPNIENTAASQDAGIEQFRKVMFSVTPTNAQAGSTCKSAVNPYAVQVGGDTPAYSQPNYVIGPSSDWSRTFADGLYYVVPSGFGTCDVSTQAPFCTRSGSAASPYAAYVPHYLDANGSGGSLSGGSTSASVVSGLQLADQYWLSGMPHSALNALVWFDNCGYGHVYQEPSSKLTDRKELPTPPDGKNTIHYSVKNSLGQSVVFAKECCASWYQENTNVNPPVLEPPVELADGYGMAVPSSTDQIFKHDTLFGTETAVVYDGVTGNRLFKVRLDTNLAGVHVYQCLDSAGSVTVSGTNPDLTIDLGGTGSGARTCRPLGDCPFPTVQSGHGNYVLCTVSDTSFILGVEDWINELFVGTPDTPITLVAWGGAGANGGGGDSTCHGGQGGLPGQAVTTLRARDLLYDGLYVYSGKSGDSSGNYAGASTILATAPISSVRSPGTVTDPGSASVLLLAAGGGAGADGDPDKITDCSGGAGGAGGIAEASQGQDVSSTGGQGGNTGASGGNTNKEGSGGSRYDDYSSSGTAGLGGWGGSGHTKWDTSGPLIPPTSWSAGTGGKGFGPDGGGGFGGGGGSGAANLVAAGGGGSWATANVTKPLEPTTYIANPGSVQIYYQATDMPGSDGLCPFGTTSFSNNGGKISCVVASSAEVNVRAWLDAAFAAKTFPQNTQVRITAWGGAGGNGGSVTVGGSTKAGGAGGDHGRASRSLTMASLQNAFAGTDGQIFAFIGDVGANGQTSGDGAGGGAATIVTIGSETPASDPTADPGSTAITLLAGGGGGGGSALAQSAGGAVGYAGAAGGVAASTPSGHGAAAGGNSCEGAPTGVTGAKGGGSGNGGSGDVSGTGGLGGYGGGGSSGRTLWIAGTIGGPQDWKNGNGGVPKKTTAPGGGGGGGWGGGGAAPASKTANQSPGYGACGGGGGGTWAKEATVADNYPELGGSPTGNRGAFELYYELPSGSTF